MKTALLTLLMTLGFAVHAGPVEITTNPDKPIVFTNDFTTTDPSGQQTTVKGPWFSLTVHINNLSADPLTIIALHVEVTGQDAAGNSVTTTKDILPSSLNYSNMGLTCSYSDFGTFNPNVSGNLSAMPSGPAGCESGVMTFFIDGNPPVQGNPSVIAYSVKVKPIGYFGGANAPKDRFDGFITISTQ